ncbi:MAG: polyphenol oxidase family protein [Candidatus Eisenbacteria bacterium]|nr:polyphenol oxidase family protein [Candidatus Eisenbacteria bacterium]
MTRPEPTAIGSPLLDTIPRVRHLFLGRAFDSPPGDLEQRETILDRAGRIGRPGEAVFFQQVHGRRVEIYPEAGTGGIVSGTVADGGATDRNGLVLAIRVADCLPVYLADREGKAVALLHAGWRGLAAGILGAGVRALAGLGVPPDRLLAWIGPSVGPCCYEVGPEVAAAFGVHGHTRPGRPGKPFLDLYATALALFQEAGVGPERVGPRPPCTACDPGRFHSHRAAPERRGRNLALLFLDP